jgi:hypothetical protein
VLDALDSQTLFNYLSSRLAKDKRLATLLLNSIPSCRSNEHSLLIKAFSNPTFVRHLYYSYDCPAKQQNQKYRYFFGPNDFDIDVLDENGEYHDLHTYALPTSILNLPTDFTYTDDIGSDDD